MASSKNNLGCFLSRRFCFCFCAFLSGESSKTPQNLFLEKAHVKTFLPKSGTQLYWVVIDMSSG
jgi:hypothetical protein